MKERPILFSGPMVRAILDGRKSQTRRIVKPQPHDSGLDPRRQTRDTVHFGFPGDQDETHPLARMGAWQLNGWYSMFPYGKEGDLLWVRETCCAKELTDDEAVEYAVQCGDPEYPRFGLDGVLYPADAHFRPIENSIAAAEAWGKLHIYRGKSGAIVPPIHMPRWASRLTLRITSVQVERLQEISEGDCLAEGIETLGRDIARESPYDAAKLRYAALWEQINGKGSWDANPWVWAIEFERIKQQAKAA
jgi:hypothetical protein